MNKNMQKGDPGKDTRSNKIGSYNTTSYEERQKQISASGSYKNDFESKIALAQ